MFKYHLNEIMINKSVFYNILCMSFPHIITKLLLFFRIRGPNNINSLAALKILIKGSLHHIYTLKCVHRGELLHM